jgi:uncharacterized protein YqeY
MALSETSLRDDMKTAMRAKDQLKLRVVRGLLAAIKNKSIETGAKELAEKDLIAIVSREAKQCKETLDAARDAGRAEMVTEHEALLAILETYLPRQLSEAELETAIKAIVAETGATSIGPVMKLLGERHGGGYDGKTASKVVGRLLAG